MSEELEREATSDASVAEMHRRLAALDPLGASRMEPTNRRRVIRALEVSLGSGRPFSSFGPGLEVYRRPRVDWSGFATTGLSSTSVWATVSQASSNGVSSTRYGPCTTTA